MSVHRGRPGVNGGWSKRRERKVSSVFHKNPRSCPNSKLLAANLSKKKHITKYMFLAHSRYPSQNRILRAESSRRIGLRPGA
jgi:hypothetical protein